MNSIVAKRLAAATLFAFVAATATAATQTEPAGHAPSIAETLTAVRQISHELKLIEERLGRLEQSLASVDASLKPLGAIAQPAEVRGLILLATGCAAGLVILHAALRRWSTSRPRN